MMDSLISVVVPVYNAEKYVAKSLRSLFSQTLIKGVEFIIVNDCSSDNSLAIINQVLSEFSHLKDQVVIINHSFNKGSAAARQTGMERATGDFLIYMDSDDWCESQMLERLYHTAVKSDADIIYCDYYINFPRKQLYRSQPATSNSKEFVSLLINGKMHGSTCNKLVKRRIYNENSVVFLSNINVWEDLLVSVKLAFFSEKIVYLPQAFLHYMQVNPVSYTSYSNEKSKRNIVQAVDGVEQFLKEHDVLDVYKEDLIFRKLYAKSDLLRYSSYSQQRQIINLYVDIPPKYVLSSSSIPFYYRIALWFAVYRQLWAANLIYKFILFAKLLFH